MFILRLLGNSFGYSRDDGFLVDRFTVDLVLVGSLSVASNFTAELEDVVFFRADRVGRLLVLEVAEVDGGLDFTEGVLLCDPSIAESSTSSYM